MGWSVPSPPLAPLEHGAQAPNQLDTQVAHGRPSHRKNAHAQRRWPAKLREPCGWVNALWRLSEHGFTQYQRTQLIGQPEPETNRQRIGHHRHGSRCRYVGTPPGAMGCCHRYLRERDHKGPEGADCHAARHCFMLKPPKLGIEQSACDRLQPGVGGQYVSAWQRRAKPIHPRWTSLFHA